MKKVLLIVILFILMSFVVAYLWWWANQPAQGTVTTSSQAIENSPTPIPQVIATDCAIIQEQDDLHIENIRIENLDDRCVVRGQLLDPRASISVQIRPNLVGPMEEYTGLTLRLRDDSYQRLSIPDQGFSKQYVFQKDKEIVGFFQRDGELYIISVLDYIKPTETVLPAFEKLIGAVEFVHSSPTPELLE